MYEMFNGLQKGNWSGKSKEMPLHFSKSSQIIIGNLISKMYFQYSSGGFYIYGAGPEKEAMWH